MAVSQTSGWRKKGGGGLSQHFFLKIIVNREGEEEWELGRINRTSGKGKGLAKMRGGGCRGTAVLG